MRFLIRLLGALWLATLVVSAAFAWYEVTEERTRLADDLQRRAALAADAVREATERLVARGARDRLRARPHALRSARPHHRHLRRVRLGHRGHRRRSSRCLGPISPLVTDAIQQQRSRPATSPPWPAARRWSTCVPLQQDDRVDRRRRRAPRRRVPRLERVGSLAAHRRAHRRPHAAADRHHLDARALVGHPADGPHRRVDQAAQVRASRSPRRRRPTSASSARWPPRSPAWPARSAARAAGRRRGGAAAAEPARACGRRSGSSSSWRSGSASDPIFVVSNREPVSHVRDGRTIVRAAAGQRPGDRARADHARVRRRVGRARQRQRRSRGGRAHRPADPTIPLYTLRRVWLTEEEETGLLLRLRQRGAVAALPHRARAPAVPRRRLGAVPRGERALRRRARGGDGEGRAADRAGAGLPLRAAAAAHQAGAAGRASGALLAHPVAELRGVRHLPLAGGDPARHARRRPRRLPHPVPLQQLPGDGGAHDRGPRSSGSDFTRRARPAHARGCGRSRSAWRPTMSRRRTPDRGDPARRARASTRSGWASAWSAWTTPRGCPSACGRSAASSSAGRSTGGAWSFVQIASPSRSRIPRYQALQQEVRETRARRINEELERAGLACRSSIASVTTTTREIRRFYRAADFCMVTSLHDGMNLVAKEYVAARDDDEGALILSRFTGRLPRAARRLHRQSLRRGGHGRARSTTPSPPIASERRSRMARMRDAGARAQHLSAGPACSWPSWRSIPQPRHRSAGD